MGKVAVVYWSGTGNTEKMASAVVEGAKAKGADVSLFNASDFNESMVDEYAAIGFGCPAMGAEVLEEAEFEPMFTSLKGKLSGKRIALFGSYGWGSGEWMTSWEETANGYGAYLVCDSVICNESPNEEGIESCKDLGAALAQ